MNLKENINRIKEVMKIDEQNLTLPQDTVAIKSTIESNQTNNATPTKYIYLTPRDVNGGVIGNKKLTYAISGSYKGYWGTFDVQIRNIKRLTNGTLYAEAKPINSFINGLMITSVKADDPTKLTLDGWFKANIPNAKINSAINTLKTASSVTVDAGNGIEVILTNV